MNCEKCGHEVKVGVDGTWVAMTRVAHNPGHCKRGPVPAPAAPPMNAAEVLTPLEALESMLDLVLRAGRLSEHDTIYQVGQYWIFHEDKVEAAKQIAVARATLAAAKSGGAL
jgi:hypothetical protein